MRLFQGHEKRALERAMSRAKRRIVPDASLLIDKVMSDQDALQTLEDYIAAEATDTGHPILDAIANLINNPEKLIALLAAIDKLFGL